MDQIGRFSLVVVALVVKVQTLDVGIHLLIIVARVLLGGGLDHLFEESVLDLVARGAACLISTRSCVDLPLVAGHQDVV